MAGLTHKTSAVLRRAAQEASALDHPIWGSEHVLLQLAASENGGRAGAMLERMGVTETRLRELLERHGIPVPNREVGQVDHVLAANEVTLIVNNTRWIAAYLHQRLADPEHLLLGTLWQEKPESKVLRELAASFEAAYRHLTGDDPPDELRPARSVYVGRAELDRLVGRLSEVLPAGVSFGFAYDEEIAWFSASPECDAEGRHVDLEGCIERALAIGC